jgi:hypothetical protein
MLNYPRKVWLRVRDLLPIEGFHFDRPLVLLQSDDWGRVGLRDQEGLEQLRSAGIELGERPYDFYTLETAEDVTGLQQTLARHRDSTGRSPCIGMNFIQANLDFGRMKAEGFRQIQLLPFFDGVPQGWNRPGLFDAYRNGMLLGVFQPSLHGNTHFCGRAVERYLADSGERGSLLRTLWEAGTPYIHWRMPWIGYEYWDPDGSGDCFLPAGQQSGLIGQAVGTFSRMFSTLPHSACAPGYRANEDTHKAWAQHGMRVAQNGPGTLMPPYLDRTGLLQLYRTVEFEPAVDPEFSVEARLRQAEECFRRGIPAIVSVHSINFHSSVKDFRSRTLTLLDDFLSALEVKHPDLLYLHDRDICELVHKGSFETKHGTVCVNVTKRHFTKAALARKVEA